MRALLFCTVILTVAGQDPAGSWLAYAKAPGGGGKLTYMNATTTVPSNPSEGGGYPAFWFGIEPEPALNLIQPILKWLGNGWYIFNEYFQWQPEKDFQSRRHQVQPGDTIFASIRLTPGNSSYEMFIQAPKDNWSISTSIPIQDHKVFKDGYVVVEHQPFSCREYPADGKITWRDINVEIEGKVIAPQWDLVKFRPACDIKVSKVSEKSIEFTWNTDGESLLGEMLNPNNIL